MKRWNGKTVFLQGMGFLIGRSAVVGMNPLAAAYFAVLAMEGIGKKGSFATLFLGIISVMEPDKIVKYGAILLVIQIVHGLMERTGHRASLAEMVVLAGGTACLVELTGGMGRYSGEAIFYGIPEGILTGAMVIIFQKGIHSFLYIRETDKKEGRSLAREKICQIAEIFQKTSNAMQPIIQAEEYGQIEMGQIYDGLTGRICRICSQSEQCQNGHRYDNYKGIQQMMYAAEGVVPQSIFAHCICPEVFWVEAEREIEMSRKRMLLERQMKENEQIMARQFEEMAYVLEEFAKDLEKEKNGREKSWLCEKLEECGVEVEELVFSEREGKPLQLHMNARMKQGCVTAKEAAVYIGKLLGRKMRPMEGGMNVISTEEKNFSFIEVEKYRILTEVTKRKKEAEVVSGDDYSVCNLVDGHCFLILADGMGSGEQAKRESAAVLERLEQFLEIGMEAESAIRLIQSSLLLRKEVESFVALDVVEIDLYDGKVIWRKSGAAPSFMIRNGQVSIISGESLPLGMVEYTQSDRKEEQLQNGDILVILSDGVLTCFSKEETAVLIEETAKEMKGKHSKNLADHIMDKVLLKNHGMVTDDMTILTAGIWEVEFYQR